MRRKAANGDLADALARPDGCGADHELIALTKACLAPEAIDRPRDAQAVAEGLSAYLNGVQERLQTAQRERAVAVAREAEQRKRRKVQLALALAVVGLLLGGGAFAFWRNEQIQREVRNAEAVVALLNQCEESLRGGDAAKAAVALDAARKRSAEGGAEHEAQRLRGLAAGEAGQAWPGASARRSATFRHTSGRTAVPTICCGHIDRGARRHVRRRDTCGRLPRHPEEQGRLRPQCRQPLDQVARPQRDPRGGPAGGAAVASALGCDFNPTVFTAMTR